MKLFALTLFLVLVTGDKAPVVKVPLFGTIEGHVAQSLNNRQLYSFEGIPYAQPPIGKYRFKEPVLPKPWNGTWHAKTIHKCIQYNQYALPNEDPVIGDEDCLYLNIYTPTLDPKANLDVIVYIHGGAFMFLYGAFYGPRYLLDRDVVFINFNYRLGPLGFLSTENEVVPGNNGIRDQILALKWVKTNIRHFGGNPDSVTIFGMSAGGASVHIHYLSPQTEGLFHRGLSQSGTALNPWVLMENGREKTMTLGQNLGCFGTIKEIVDCLKTRPAKQIVASVKKYQPWLYNPFSPFGVVVDSWASDPVLPEHPYSLIKKGKVKNLPWIASMTNFEGLYPASDFLHDQYLDHIDKHWNRLLPHILDFNYTVKPHLHNEVSEKIRKRYLGGKKVDSVTITDFIQILSDRLFALDIHKTVKLQASVVNSPIYFYFFTYRGAHTWYESQAEPRHDFGAAHAEDTAYLLSTPTADTTTTEEDKEMVKFFVEMMVSYAKHGSPNVGIEWAPVSKSKDIDALKIESGDRLTIEKLKIEDEEFWESLPIEENEKIVDSFKKDEL